MLLSAFALLAVFFSCQKESLSVMNNTPQGFLGGLEGRNGGRHHHGDSLFVCDSLHQHDSLHIHHDSLHIHHDSLHVHTDSLHIHHDSTAVDTTGHNGGGHGGHNGGGHGGHNGGGHGGHGGPGGGPNHHGHGG